MTMLRGQEGPGHLVIPPAADDLDAQALGDAQSLIEEARRRQRRRRRWMIGIIVIVLAASGSVLVLRHGNGGGHSGGHIQHQGKVRTPAPTPPPASPVTPVGALKRPAGMAIAPNGDVLISNQGSNEILSRQPDGTFQVVAGNGAAGFSGDGGPAVDAELNDPNGLAVAPDGAVYLADTGNNRIREIAPDGIITTVAGNGTLGAAGEGGPATAAQIDAPSAVTLGPEGNLYVADDSVGIQAVSPDGVLSTVIPIGTETPADAAAAALSLNDPTALAIDGSGDLYVASFSPKMILEFSPSGKVLQSWGSYVTPAGLGVTPDGSIVVADYGRFAIERIADGQMLPITTFSTNSLPGVPHVFRPSGVVISFSGEIYADTDGANGGTNTPALIAIDPGGQVHILATGAPTIS